MDLPEGVVSKKMYHVKKFEPRNCPHCNGLFVQSGADWHNYLGKIVDGKKVPDPEYPRIMCTRCQNLVPITMIEEYQVGDVTLADKLCNEHGFFDLTEVLAVGNMTQDHRVTYSKDNQPKLLVINCEGEEPCSHS